MEIKKRNLEKSEECYKRALKVVPAQCHTLSHGPTQYVSGASPKYIYRGKGCLVWDVDGNEYLDLAPGGYPITLGYAYEPVNRAIREQLELGTLYPMPNPLEVETAELLTEIIPCAEMVKFAKNGSDVTSMAIRVSRAITGREKVAAIGYHGWHDWHVAITTRLRGIPNAVQELSLKFEYNNLESLKTIFDENEGEIAAVMMEPIQLTLPENNFLTKVKDLAHKEGAIFIFDEIMTGNRVSLGGAQEYFKIIPDMACFGKTLANGMPISALVGKREIMENFSFDGVFFSSTFGGECASLAACKATLTELRDKKVNRFMWKQGKKLQDGFNKLAKEYGLEGCMACKGLPPLNAIVFNNENLDVTEEEMKSLFQQECMKRGMLAGLYHGLCYAHEDKYIDLGLEIYEDAMSIFKNVLAEGADIRGHIEGEVVKEVFRHKK